MRKRLSKTIWYGSEVDTEGNPVVPRPSEGADDLEGLHHGELYLHEADDNLSLWARTLSNEVKPIGGFGGGGSLWKLMETESGEKFLFTELNVVTQMGITSFADNKILDLPDIYDGLPIDNNTLYWELDENGKKTVLKAKGGGEGTLVGIEVTGKGNAITDVTPSSDGTKLVFSKGITFVDKSYLDENFYTKTYIADTFYTKQYIDDVLFKKDDATDLFVTLDETEQEILGIKIFKEGIKIGNSRIHQPQDGVLFLDGHLVVSGSVTTYGDNGDIDIPTIWAGLPIDENTLVRNEEGVLMVNPNIELGGASSWDEISGKPKWITDTKPSYTYSEISGTPDLSVYASKDDLKEYVSLTGTESVEGIKDFVNGIAIDGLSIYKSQDDVVYVDANLVVRGAVVMFGNAIADIPSFMESLLLDENTLTLNEEGRLTVICGTGGGSIEYPLSWSGFDSGSYDGSVAKSIYIPSKVSELTNDSSFITSSSLNGYATETWVNGKGFITSSALNGYATESYVTSRGYITSSALSGYATESWVNGKGYLTSSSLNGYATQSWVTGQGYATSAALGAYLPKSGGTMTGNLWIPSAYAKISAASSGNAYITFFNSGNTSALGDIGVLSTSKPAFYDYGSKVWLNLVYNTNWCKLNTDSSSNPYLLLRHSSGTTHYIQNYNSYLYLGAGSSKSFRIDTNGNCLAVGGITMYSDQRKKTILNHVELSLKQIANAPLIEHYYNSDERKTTHVGSIAQYWAGLNDWFCKKDDDGYYTMEIQNAALASAISIARELVKYETKTDKQIRRLKNRINELEEEIEKLKTA